MNVLTRLSYKGVVLRGWCYHCLTPTIGAMTKLTRVAPDSRFLSTPEDEIWEDWKSVLFEVFDGVLAELS